MDAAGDLDLTMETPCHSVAWPADLDVPLARSDAYRLTAAALRDPDGPLAGELELPALEDALATLRIVPSAAEQEALGRVVDPAARAREHRLLFGHTVAHGCPPYETEYGRRHVFGQAQDLADLAGFYAAFGLRPAPGGERADHLTCEIEFLAVLTLKEAIAVAMDFPGAATVSREAAVSFLRDHLGWWLPALAALAARRAPGSGLVALLALATRLVLDHAAAIGAVPERLGPDDLRPIQGHADGFVFACGPPDADPALPG